jgi:hypothetical protein
MHRIAAVGWRRHRQFLARRAFGTAKFGYADRDREPQSSRSQKMSVTEPLGTRTEQEIRGRTAGSYSREARETKPSFMTTEFWTMLVGIVAIVVVYNAAADTTLNLFRASLLAAVLAVGYVISRGLAKAGSRDETWVDDRRS